MCNRNFHTAAAMNLYDRFILPTVLDFTCGLKPFRMQRQKVVPRATGRVLEVGIGTGLNLPHYCADGIDALHGLDPAAELTVKARKRARAAGLDVEMRNLSAESIDAEDASYDCVVCTYSLCTIPDALSALHEMRRVLRPGGYLLFCEHGKSPDAGVARWQQRLTPMWRAIAGGCHLDRDIPALLREGGFASSDMQTGYIPGPRVLTYNYWGSATAIS